MLVLEDIPQNRAQIIFTVIWSSSLIKTSLEVFTERIPFCNLCCRLSFLQNSSCLGIWWLLSTLSTCLFLQKNFYSASSMEGTQCSCLDLFENLGGGSQRAVSNFPYSRIDEQRQCRVRQSEASCSFSAWCNLMRSDWHSMFTCASSILGQALAQCPSLPHLKHRWLLLASQPSTISAPSPAWGKALQWHVRSNFKLCLSCKSKTVAWLSPVFTTSLQWTDRRRRLSKIQWMLPCWLSL